jgi:branched-chain amino acid transport system substrate-binding protein
METGSERSQLVSMEDERVLLAAAVSLSGRYARQGRLAAAGLQQAVADVCSVGGVRLGARRFLPKVLVLDDAGTGTGVRRALDAVGGADLVLGPYGSDLVRTAGRWAAERGRVLWNHGGSADDVERLPGVVSLASPASRYLAVVLEALGAQWRSARVLVAVGRGRFAQHAAEGAWKAAARLGMSVVAAVSHEEVPEHPEAEVLLIAGSFEQDVGILRRLRVRPPVIGAVAGGIGAFANELGRRAEGVLAPSQWEEGVHFPLDVGPRSADVVRALRARVLPTLSAGAGTGHVEYPCAQAYAAVLVALRCVEKSGSLDDEALLDAARSLRCTTFFGRFGLGDDGRQSDHNLVVVQWRAGVKRVVWPPDAYPKPHWRAHRRDSAS